MNSEPLLLIITGGTVLVQAFLQLLVAFGVPVTAQQQAAVMTFCGVVFPLIARQKTVPIAQLPPGTTGKMADAAAAKLADTKPPSKD